MSNGQKYLEGPDFLAAKNDPLAKQRKKSNNGEEIKLR